MWSAAFKVQFFAGFVPNLVLEQGGDNQHNRVDRAGRFQMTSSAHDNSSWLAVL